MGWDHVKGRNYMLGRHTSTYALNNVAGVPVAPHLHGGLLADMGALRLCAAQMVGGVAHHLCILIVMWWQCYTSWGANMLAITVMW
jgi:hypothetical protein